MLRIWEKGKRGGAANVVDKRTKWCIFFKILLIIYIYTCIYCFDISLILTICGGSTCQTNLPLPTVILMPWISLLCLLFGVFMFEFVLNTYISISIHISYILYHICMYVYMLFHCFWYKKFLYMHEIMLFWLVSGFAVCIWHNEGLYS